MNDFPIKLFMLLFFAIIYWNCSTSNDCEGQLKPDVEYPTAGNYYINRPISFYVKNYNDSVSYEIKCDPKEAGTIEFIDSVNIKITPKKTGYLKVEITSIKNNCYSDPINVTYIILANRLSQFENTIWKGNLKIFNDYVLTSSEEHSVIIEYVNEDQLFIKGEDGYFYGAENKSNSKILIYQKSSGPSYKNGTPTYKLDLTKKTLKFDHCTYYGHTNCLDGSYKLK